MATTWLKSIHKGGGIAAALGRSVDYISDSDKTNEGELIDSYECNPRIAVSEFLMSKREYEHITGRNQGKNNVIAYHIRMSFKPGEVTAEQALALGYELGLRWTKGLHQFVTAAHTNTNNPHIHIIYNSINLNCDGKYQDFKRSAIALRRVSDQICIEHGLSIIEKPGLSQGRNRDEYLGEGKPKTNREQLCDLMDSVISDCKDYTSFLENLQSAGIEIKRGKQLSFKLPDAKRFMRHDSLGENYSEAAIRNKITVGAVMPAQKVAAGIPEAPGLLIDVQNSIKAQNSPGYERWAKTFNLKQVAKTLIFLQENGFDDLGELGKAVNVANEDCFESELRIEKIKGRQGEIAQLQKHIGGYVKNKDVYAEYRRQKFSNKFKDENEKALSDRKAAKAYFDLLGLDKLPTIDMLRKEYATLESEKKVLVSTQGAKKKYLQKLLTARGNVERLLGYDIREKMEREAEIRRENLRQYAPPELERPRRRAGHER